MNQDKFLTKYGVEGVTYAYNDQGKIDYLPEVKKIRTNRQ